VVLLAREFGWTLEEMRNLRPSELTAILEELKKQKTLDEYHEMRNKWAFLAAVITNAASVLANVFGGSKRKPKQVKPDDFIGKEAKKAVDRLTKKAQQEDDRWAGLIQEAKVKGLKGPWN